MQFHGRAPRDRVSRLDSRKTDAQRHDRGAGFQRQARRSTTAAQQPVRIVVDCAFRKDADRPACNQVRPRPLQRRHGMLVERLQYVEEAWSCRLARDGDNLAAAVDEADAGDEAKVPVSEEMDEAPAPGAGTAWLAPATIRGAYRGSWPG